MVERLLRCFLVIAFAIAPLSGCAYMSKNGRQQMAYQRYVKKFSGRQVKQKKKIKAPRMPLTPQPSENKVNTQVTDSSAPQSVTSGESQTGD